MFEPIPASIDWTLFYRVTRDLSESLDLEQILATTLRFAAQINPGSSGILLIFDAHGGLEKHLAFADGKTFKVKETQLGRLMRIEVVQQAKMSREVVRFADFSPPPSAQKDAAPLFAPGQLVAFPLQIKQHLLGLLFSNQPLSQPMTDHVLSMLTAVAGQATTAILNSRLYQAEQYQRKLSDALSQIFRHMSRSDKLHDLFELIFKQIGLVISFDQCAIFLLSQDDITVAAAKGIKNLADVENFPIQLYENDFAAPLFDLHIPLLSADLQAEYTWFRDVTDITSRSWMCVPLLSGGMLLGLITVASNRPGQYMSDDLKFINDMARQSAVAIKNTTLFSQLQEIKKRYTSLFEESSDLLLIIDPNGIIREANRKTSQILRRPKDVLIGTQLALLDSTLRQVFTQQVIELETKPEFSTEVTLKDAYGQRVVLQLEIKQVEIDGQILIQWSGKDITASRELARARYDMVNMIVHDLRGPLGNLLGTMQLLSMVMEELAGQPIYEETAELLNIAGRSGRYLEDLIDSVLDLSRLEQDGAPLSLKKIPFENLLAEVREQTETRASMKNIDLRFELQNPALAVSIDHSMIRRVLVNLIDNATKYTPSGGHVSVKIESSSDEITVSVQDDGPGIARDKQATLFEKFTRATADRAIQGVGLGLAFCKMAIEAHHGRIRLESQDGQGSTFYFSIPRNLKDN